MFSSLISQEIARPEISGGPSKAAPNEINFILSGRRFVSPSCASALS